MPARPGTKIVQAGNPLHDSAQSAGQRWVGGVGIVGAAVDYILMNRRAERRFHLSCRATERDPGAAARRRDITETLLAQPGRRPLDVDGAYAEALGILLGGKPVVIVRGGPVLLLLEQRLEALLLRRGQTEDQPHASHREPGVHASAIKLGTRDRRNAAWQALHTGIVDLRRNSLGLRAGVREQAQTRNHEQS